MYPKRFHSSTGYSVLDHLHTYSLTNLLCLRTQMPTLTPCYANRSNPTRLISEEWLSHSYVKLHISHPYLSLSRLRPSFRLPLRNHAQLAQHIAIPTQAKLGIFHPAMIGSKNAALGTNKNVVVRGLVALVNAIVPQNTAQEPSPPHKTISQWKKKSRK